MIKRRYCSFTFSGGIQLRGKITNFLPKPQLKQQQSNKEKQRQRRGQHLRQQYKKLQHQDRQWRTLSFCRGIAMYENKMPFGFLILKQNLHLRSYQRSILTEIENLVVKEKEKSILVTLATGLGKTVLFPHLLRLLEQKSGKQANHHNRHNNQKNLKNHSLQDQSLKLEEASLRGNRNTHGLLIVVHKEELLQQTILTIKKWFPSYVIGIDRGKETPLLRRMMQSTITNTTKNTNTNAKTNTSKNENADITIVEKMEIEKIKNISRGRKSSRSISKKSNKAEFSLQIEKEEVKPYDVIIASVQSIGRNSLNAEKRLEKYIASSFGGIIVIDEAHHVSTTSTYARVIDKLAGRNFSSSVSSLRRPSTQSSLSPSTFSSNKLNDLANKNRILIGFTATPFRESDIHALDYYFPARTTERNLIWGVKNGYLVDIKCKTVTHSTNPLPIIAHRRTRREPGTGRRIGVGTDTEEAHEKKGGIYITPANNREASASPSAFYDKNNDNNNAHDNNNNNNHTLNERESQRIEMVSIRKGDFDASDLNNYLNTRERNLAIVEAFQRHGGQYALIFCISIEHAEAVASLFNQERERLLLLKQNNTQNSSQSQSQKQTQGRDQLDLELEDKKDPSHRNNNNWKKQNKLLPRAGCIHGQLSSEERSRVLQEFYDERSDLGILTNCQVLTEGFDAPFVDTIIMARPTLSQGLYMQMLGRGVRAFNVDLSNDDDENSEVIIDQRLRENEAKVELDKTKRIKTIAGSEKPYMTVIDFVDNCTRNTIFTRRKRTLKDQDIYPRNNLQHHHDLDAKFRPISVSSAGCGSGLDLLSVATLFGLHDEFDFQLQSIQDHIHGNKNNNNNDSHGTVFEIAQAIESLLEQYNIDKNDKKIKKLISKARSLQEIELLVKERWLLSSQANQIHNKSSNNNSISISSMPSMFPNRRMEETEIDPATAIAPLPAPFNDDATNRLADEDNGDTTEVMTQLKRRWCIELPLFSSLTSTIPRNLSLSVPLKIKAGDRISTHPSFEIPTSPSANLGAAKAAKATMTGAAIEDVEEQEEVEEEGEEEEGMETQTRYFQPFLVDVRALIKKSNNNKSKRFPASSSSSFLDKGVVMRDYFSKNFYIFWKTSNPIDKDKEELFSNAIYLCFGGVIRSVAATTYTNKHANTYKRINTSLSSNNNNNNYDNYNTHSNLQFGRKSIDVVLDQVKLLPLNQTGDDIFISNLIKCLAFRKSKETVTTATTRFNSKLDYFRYERLVHEFLISRGISSTIAHTYNQDDPTSSLYRSKVKGDLKHNISPLSLI